MPQTNEEKAAYQRQWSQNHKGWNCEIVKKWQQKNTEKRKANHNASRAIPLLEFCEACPEDDIRKATERHHPDYDYPSIIVSCCSVCHNYLDECRSD